MTAVYQAEFQYIQ
jgi:hypothetical protein